MTQITPLWDEMPLSIKFPKQKNESETPAVVNPFTDIFRSAVDAVRETSADRDQMEYLMSTGQLDNPALLNIATTKASIATDLLVSLRSKAMDAYNELMRISL